MPKIVFRTSKNEEIKNLILFSSKYDIALHSKKTLLEMMLVGRRRVLKIIRKITLKEREKFIRNYIEKEYKNLNLEVNKSKIKKDWAKIEKRFFHDTSKMFDNHKWPSNKYYAYLSILSAYPRYLDAGKFFIPADNKRKNIRYVMIHELLHFLFYNFYNANFKGKLSSMKLWHLSEIINYLIMDEKQLAKYYKKRFKPCIFHRVHYHNLRQDFRDRKSMKWFIKKAIVYMKNQQLA